EIAFAALEVTAKLSEFERCRPRGHDGRRCANRPAFGNHVDVLPGKGALLHPRLLTNNRSPGCRGGRKAEACPIRIECERVTHPYRRWRVGCRQLPEQLPRQPRRLD